MYEMGREKLYALCDFNCKVKDNMRTVVPIYDDADGEPENDEVIQLHDKRDINTTVWDVITWYFSPEPERSPNLSTAKQDRDFARDFQDNKRLCADAVPFIGQALSTQYARMISSGAYIGFADTGLFCNSPLALPAFLLSLWLMKTITVQSKKCLSISQTGTASFILLSADPGSKNSAKTLSRTL